MPIVVVSAVAEIFSSYNENTSDHEESQDNDEDDMSNMWRK